MALACALACLCCRATAKLAVRDLRDDADAPESFISRLLVRWDPSNMIGKTALLLMLNVDDNEKKETEIESNAYTNLDLDT